MGLSFVWFELPNMDIYFNKILGVALMLYIIYFFTQRAFLNSYIKDEFESKNYWYINRFLGILRLLPAILIIFAMYNIDNVSFIDALVQNECRAKELAEFAMNNVYNIK